MEINKPELAASSAMPVPPAKHWHKHKGLITIAILAVITVLVSWVYFKVSQPKIDKLAGTTITGTVIKNYQGCAYDDGCVLTIQTSDGKTISAVYGGGLTPHGACYLNSGFEIAAGDQVELHGTYTDQSTFSLCGAGAYIKKMENPASPNATSTPSSSYEKSSLSWTYITGVEDGKVKVYLYAPDQKTEVNKNPWAFAMEGDTVISGHYKLILDPSTASGGLDIPWPAAQIDLGELQFNKNRPDTDGKLYSLQLDPNAYQDAVAFYQYGSSNTDVIYLYRLVSDKFSLVHFISKNGKSFNFTETGLGDELRPNLDNTFTSEWYDNTRGYVTTKWKYNSKDNNFHEIETKVSSNPPSAIGDVATWKTFHSAKYGISFKYPSDLTQIIVSKDGSFGVPPPENPPGGGELSGIDITMMPFNTVFDVRATPDKLYYDPNASQWMLGLWTVDQNNPTYKSSCEEVVPLGVQKVPSYSVAYKYSQKFAVIIKQGLIVISENPVEEPIPPSAHELFDTMLGTITFDHPELAVKAKCN